MRAAILGLGPMGAGIAANLAAAGWRPVVWNRSAGPRERIAALDVEIAASLDRAIAETVLSVLPDVDQLRAVSGPRVWKAWSDAGVRRVVVMSTTHPDKVTALAADLAEYGLAVADAPMSGGEHGSVAGTLSIMVGAHDEDWAAVRSTLAPAASRIALFGPPGSGSVAKLCNQIVVAGTLSALAEALALAERAEIDREALLDVFENGLAASAVLAPKRDRLLGCDYTPSGSAVNQLKDLRYIGAVAHALEARTPVVDAITPLFEAVVASG